MRNPLRKTLLALGLAASAAAVLLVTILLYERLGKTASTILAIPSLTVAVLSLFTAVWTLSYAIGYARLIRGGKVIARWHLTPAEWDRFRAFDVIRAAQHLSLRNDLRIAKQIPANGVDVIVGHNVLVVDNSFHRIHRVFGGRQLNWLNAPVDPECLEFPKAYARRYGGALQLTLRVPVPASARAEGVRVFQHYQALLPKPGAATLRNKLIAIGVIVLIGIGLMGAAVLFG